MTPTKNGLDRPPERDLQVRQGMSIFSNLFGRRSGFNIFRRRTPVVTPRRAGMSFGTLAALAAPFIVRKIMARRARNNYGAAY